VPVVEVVNMYRKIRFAVVFSQLFLLIVLIPAVLYATDSERASNDADAVPIVIPADMGDTMAREAERVRTEFHDQAKSLFVRTPLGWDWGTIGRLYSWGIGLPGKVPQFLGHVIEQGRLLGVVGSFVVLAFIAAVFYSLIGQKRVLVRVETSMRPVTNLLPDVFHIYVRSGLRVVIAALIPLILLGAFHLINAFIVYTAPWFHLTGRLLGLWAVGVLFINLLRESLMEDLFPVSPDYGETIFRISRSIILYALVCIALLWGAAAFSLKPDFLALLKFLISLSIVFALVFLLLRKNALLSLLPDLPYPAYQTFLRTLDRYYFPVMFFTFLSGLLWCFGYQRFCEVLWKKTWAVAGSFIVVMLLYHFLRKWLERWLERKGSEDEQVRFLFESVKVLLLYATITVTVGLVLFSLGLLDPLQRIMSFPVLKIGVTSISLWIIIKAGLILVAIVYVTRLLQAYLDYKVYPALGVEPGLAYVLNTFLRYFGAAVGFLFALRVVGIDLRMLLVFAGAIGIGIGLGLQSMAANVISGFSIVFGRKLRKDDWIQVGDTLGVVTDIYLRATKVRTRDNVEYLIPNADFISSTLVNFTLSAPTIRIHVPVGVSYKADPETVRKILIASAEKHTEAVRHHAPEVRFVEYGNNSINFELLVWMDVRETEESLLRSMLYFTIFEELKKAGIEIPFPQRDLHIRSGLLR
jgi:small-conductance mechanosensitive channel